MSKKNKIGYVAPPEPKFIREMKAKLGFQYQDSLDTKLAGDAGDFDDREGQEQGWHSSTDYLIILLSIWRDGECSGLYR